MSEMNQRWKREYVFTQKLAGFFAACAAVMWPVSYYTSYSAAQTGQGMWFAAVSVATLVAAIGTTGGAAVMAGTAFTDAPPLPGDNR